MANTRLLVVEDDGLIRLDLVDTLADMGFDVVDAENADDALVVLEAEKDISAVLTDIDMPGSMDGVGLARLIVERWPPIKVVVISGRYTPMDGVLPGEVRFLIKPVSEKIIVRTLEDIGILPAAA